MFPNIPRAYIIRELDRADGSSGVAIDNLLLLAPDFNTAREEEESISTTPLVNTSSHTHKSILSSLNSVTSSTSLDSSDSPQVELNKKNWDSFDATSRRRILSDRKREMVKKARELFLKGESNK
jgi:hypothetical protein